MNNREERKASKFTIRRLVEKRQLTGTGARKTKLDECGAVLLQRVKPPQKLHGCALHVTPGTFLPVVHIGKFPIFPKNWKF